MKYKKTRSAFHVNLASPWQKRGSDLLAPAVLMKQGVFCGSAGCCLHTAESLENSVNKWNGVPVVIDHPYDSDGMPVGLRQLSVSERRRLTVGHLEQARFEDNALQATIVITTSDKTQRETIMKTRSVSIGAFTTDVPATGSYRGKQYDMISQKYDPDHLAILPGNNPACKWDDGCGIRANANEPLPDVRRTKPKPAVDIEEKLFPAGIEVVNTAGNNINIRSVSGYQIKKGN